jgi:hypothetical protein
MIDRHYFNREIICLKFTWNESKYVEMYNWNSGLEGNPKKNHQEKQSRSQRFCIFLICNFFHEFNLLCYMNKNFLDWSDEISGDEKSDPFFNIQHKKLGEVLWKFWNFVWEIYLNFECLGLLKFALIKFP